MALQSVSKTIVVLEAFLEFTGGKCSVSELSRKLEWSRAATHQYVSTLAEAGWLVQNAKRDYMLSPRAAIFGRFAIEYSKVPPEVTRAMVSLVEKLNEPISYAVLNRNEAIIIERHEPNRPFAITSAMESHLELRTSASGIVLLAFDSHVNHEDWRDVRGQLEEARRLGYAESRSTWLGDEIEAIAVPIMSRDECYGAISVIAPAGRMDLSNARKALTDTRIEVEQALDPAASKM